MTDDRRPHCERTSRLIDRVVAETVTADDREHASTCPACGPVLLRAARFDDELRRTARGLVTQQLPDGVLDPEIAPAPVGGVPPMRHAGPGLASILAAVVVLVVAASVAIAPNGLGPGSDTPPPTGLGMAVPALRSTVDIIKAVQALEYFCTPGHALATTGPSARPGEREGAQCLTPKSIDSARATIIPVETGDGRVVEVTVEGELYGSSTLTSQQQLATTMGKLTHIAISDPGVAADAGRWVEEQLPRLRVLPSGDDALMYFDGVRIFLQRYIVGGYRLVISPT